MSVANSSHLTRWLLSLPPVEFVMQQLRETLIGSLKCGPIPKHIAFVMDGNRRYARKNKVETVEGHHLGFEALARILEVCYKSGVKVVTIYAFSIENFKRSKYEVDGLMDMAKTKLVQMSQHGELFDRYGASVRILGDHSLIREDVLEQVNRAVEMTKHNHETVLNVCFPYTGREEITHSIRETVREFSEPPKRTRQKRPFSETHIQRNILNRTLSAQDLETSSNIQYNSSQTSRNSSPIHKAHSTTSISSSSNGRSRKNMPDAEAITAEILTRNMYTADAPPLDLLIRTSGVQRLSDFLLWQCHETTEMRFLGCLWPEFDLWHFLPVLLEWQWKQRRVAAEKRSASKALS
ncbi:Undecaprenyl diphosphate synthase [Dissoconium aciculare CBS 342.82]|uniref:Alkyl transferase n=1 Tax=Dissoconium aciculare CBS 342.82 TaxID=1314786 RepID=A0A6J3M2V9_9PEZI|nr:Undecaprenyl diphosphate synthase [Dissoconium aciculare CBS 342.82]KAF1822233.1 Undecaprenyl diphosphate synthase [Dissoconium aciculare CBS 342.82]